MNKNRKVVINLFFFALFASGLLFSSFTLFNKQPVKAQAAADFNFFGINEQNMNLSYYWYRLSVQSQFIISQNNIKKEIFEVINVFRLQSGTIKEFEKDLWEALSQRAIIVGPFEFREYAELSRNVYLKLLNVKTEDEFNKVTGWPNPIAQNVQYFSFPVALEEAVRIKIFILDVRSDPMPVSSLKTYIKNVFLLLQEKQVTIGPFQDAQRAADAVRLYRRAM